MGFLLVYSHCAQSESIDKLGLSVHCYVSFFVRTCLLEDSVAYYIFFCVGGSTLLHEYVVGILFPSVTVPSNHNLYTAHLRCGRLFYTSYEMFADRCPSGTSATLFSIDVFGTVLTLPVGFIHV